MRRRQAYHVQAEESAVEKHKAVEAAPWVPAAKGFCPICGKHVGRGVAFHMKGCKVDE